MTEAEEQSWRNYFAYLRSIGDKCDRCGMPVDWHQPHPEWCLVNHPAMMSDNELIEWLKGFK